MGKSKGFSKEGQVSLSIHVIPGAKKNEIVEILPEKTIRIKIKAPPVEGKANLALVKYLQELFNITSSQIEIFHGMQSRNKIIKLLGINEELVYEIISGEIKKLD